VKLCEPCKHLVDVSGKRTLLPTLVHRGGLHAQILDSGVIRAGDQVEELRRCSG
jgi:MOSC domain-containing protein YiiM